MVKILANPLIVYTLYTHHIYVFLSCGTLFFYFKCAGDVTLRASSDTRIK